MNDCCPLIYLCYICALFESINTNFNLTKMSDNVKDPNDLPVGKRERKKREKVAKERVHIYISEDSLGRIDQKADELGLDRSPCIQMLINIGLNNLSGSNVLGRTIS